MSAGKRGISFRLFDGGSIVAIEFESNLALLDLFKIDPGDKCCARER